MRLSYIIRIDCFYVTFLILVQQLFSEIIALFSMFDLFCKSFVKTFIFLRYLFEIFIIEVWIMFPEMYFQSFIEKIFT